MADVFDSLGSKRCYRAAWSLAEIIDLMKEQRGLHFEPRAVDMLLDNLDQVLAIREAFPDEPNRPH